MRLIRSTIAILAIVSASASLAGEVGTVSYGAIFANKNCAWCHGPSLQGFATAPRLAGQKPQYLMIQLHSFRDHTRDNPLSQDYMWGAAANHLSYETARELAAYVASLDTKAANNGHRVLIAVGHTLYREGSPATNIPACVACHGPNAEGFGEIPRLGGLSYHYLKRRLGEWGEGYHLTAAAPMPEVASKLSPDEIDALASYLSFVN